MSVVSQNMRKAMEAIRSCIRTRGGYGYCPAQGLEDAQTDLCPNRLDLLRAAIRLMARCECPNKMECKAREAVEKTIDMIESVENNTYDAQGKAAKSTSSSTFA